jgi:hypothetical protein
MDKHTYLNKHEKEKKMLERISNELEKALKDKGLQKKIKKHFEELKIKQERCEKKGHPKAKCLGIEYMPNNVVYMHCNSCDLYYTRGLNEQEVYQMQRTMNRRLD